MSDNEEQFHATAVIRGTREWLLSRMMAEISEANMSTIEAGACVILVERFRRAINRDEKTDNGLLFSIRKIQARINQFPKDVPA